MPTEILIKYPIAFLTAFLVAYLLTPPVIALAKRIGLVDQPGGRRIHRTPTPRGGGLAVFLGIQAACAVVFLLPWSGFLGNLDETWWRHFASLATLMLLLGLADDKWGVRAPVKLAAQTAIALAAYTLGMRAGNAFGFHLPLLLDAAITVFWFLAIVNAFNLIDGIDGLATGLGAIAGLGLAGWLVMRRMPGDVLVTLGLAGACMGFLRYNFHPARCFLGDCGSLSIGFAVAAVSLSTGSKGTTLAAVGVPLLAVGVPLFDTLLAVWRRTVAGLLRRPDGTSAGGIMRADMEHLHHRLVRSGLSQGAVAGRLYAASACLIAVGLLSMVFHAKAMAIYVIAFVAVTYVVVRHLARSEIQASGEAILEGLRRPARPTVLLALHPATDAAVLLASFSAALFLTKPEWGLEEYKLVWFAQLPFWVGVPLLAFALSGVYSQVWSQARPADFTRLSATLVMSLLLALGITGLTPDARPATLFVRWLIMLGLTQFGIALRRAIPQSARDMTNMTRLHDTPPSDNADIQLVYGAGSGGSLYLDSLNLNKGPGSPPPHIAGFVDDSPHLHGRIVRGLKVLGGVERIEELIPANRVRSIVVAAELSPERAAQLSEIAGKTGVSVVRWRASLEPIPPADRG